MFERGLENGLGAGQHVSALYLVQNMCAQSALPLTGVFLLDPLTCLSLRITAEGSESGFNPSLKVEGVDSPLLPSNAGNHIAALVRGGFMVPTNASGCSFNDHCWLS